MNNDLLNELIKGIGMMTELWLIMFQNFKAQKLSDDEAIQHTKAFMAVMMESFTRNNSEEAN